MNARICIHVVESSPTPEFMGNSGCFMDLCDCIKY